MTSGKPPAMESSRLLAQQQLADQAEILDSVRDAIAATDANFLITFWNSAAESIYGWVARDVLGLPLSELFGPAYLAVDRTDILPTLLATGRFQGEMTARRKDGERVFLEASASVRRDAHGRVKGYVTINRDISERKLSEEALRLSEQKFSNAFRASPVALSINRARDGMFLDVNETFELQSGYSRREIIGSSVSDLALFHSPEDYLALLDDLRRRRSIRHRQITLRKKSGELYLTLCSAEPIEVAGQSCLLTVAEDITARQEAESLLAGESRVLNQIARSLPLPQALATLCQVIEEQSAGSLCSVALLDPSGKFLRHIVAPNLHPDFVQALDALEIGEHAASAGAAAFHRSLQQVSDILIDPRWSSCRVPAMAFGLRSCWAAPILSTTDQILGSFAIYWREPHPSNAHDLLLINRATHLAGMAIERSLAADALRHSEANYRSLVEGIPLGICRLASDGAILMASHAFAEMLGFDSAAELRGLNLFEKICFEEESRLSLENCIRSAAAFRSFESAWKRRDGSRIAVLISGRPMQEKEGAPIHFEVVADDVTQRRILEDQLRQSQKMESIALFAGGMAHDFNNLLTGILGQAELLLQHVRYIPEARKRTRAILHASLQGRSLTQQLLTLSHHSALQAVPLNLNAVIADLAEMLRRLVGEHIDLRTALDEQLPLVKADPANMTQIVMNLVLNARDAMSSGGSLTLSTHAIERSATADAALLNAPGGSYVLLTVTDTGLGMDAQTRSKIFEPFFTTKSPGAGTGLGLCTVLGIVQHHGGYIGLDSEPGKGASVRIYFPAFQRTETQAEVHEPAPPRPPLTGKETVLVVEDNTFAQEITTQFLLLSGYRVLEARNGHEAMLLCNIHKEEIHLLLTDVVMPGMSGPQLARLLLHSRPHMKVLYMTGYSDVRVFSENDFLKGTPLIQKPYLQSELLHKVRAVLGEEPKN